MTPARLSPQIWLSQASGYRDFNYQQTAAYSELMAGRSRAETEYWSLGSRGGLAAVRVKAVRGTGLGVAYVAGGPIVRPPSSEEPAAEEALRESLQALLEEFVTHRRLLLRVSPVARSRGWNEITDRTSRSLGFLPAKPTRTMVLDIEADDDHLRAGFTKKWRYYLKRSERAGMEIEQGRSTDLFGEFKPLFNSLVQRKQFDVDLDAGFYGDVQEELDPAHRFHLLLARVEGEAVAGLVGSVVGDHAVYLLGASTDRGRAVNAGYALQWEMIKAARDRFGCSYYDLGGTDPAANPGVHKFKVGLGGEEITRPGTYEKASSSARRIAVVGAERAYRQSRELVGR